MIKLRIVVVIMLFKKPTTVVDLVCDETNDVLLIHYYNQFVSVIIL